MNILYIGDVMGPFGVQVLRDNLTQIKAKHRIDLTFIQAENVTLGKGLTISDYHYLQSLGVDFFMSGNHIYHYPEIMDMIDNVNEPIVGLANYGTKTKFKIFDTKFGKILIFSLLGQIVGKDSNLIVDNPLQVADEILNQVSLDQSIIFKLVNFHGDYSSEKVVIGQFLDGRVQAVIGDHWHVPTNDARILPKGTAHITDVGMCGALNSSLGVKSSIIINRWLTNQKSRNILENNGLWQFNAVKIEYDNSQVKNITSINLIEH